MFRKLWMATAKTTMPALVLASLAGCATVFPGGISPTNQHQVWSYQGSRVTFMPEAAAPLLAEATVGDRIDAGATPWGESTSVTVMDRFFAASGRECMKAKVDGGAGSHLVNLCQYEANAWGATQVLLTESAEVTP